ncbi:MAG: T9SS type A sorting domain-containing protein [candidate division WOR-3 bacterium]
MKGIITLLCIAALSATATSTPENPVVGQDNPWFYQSATSIPDDQQIPVGVGQHSGIDQASLAPPSGTQYTGPDQHSNSSAKERWGDDVFVMAHGMPTFGYLSTDQDELTGDMYASLLVPHAGFDDTAYTYRSQDGGETWQQFGLVAGASGTGGIRDHEILVGHEGGTAWIYDFVLYDGASATGGLYVRRIRPDYTNWTWTLIVPWGDTLENIHADRNIETPQHIFACWETSNDGIRMQSSSDYSLTWGNQRNVSSGSHVPTVAAGGDGYVYIAYQSQDTVQIRIGRYTNNLISPSFVFNSVDTDPEGDFTPSITAARTTPGASQCAWVLYRHRDGSGNASIRVGYTTTGSTSWNSEPWPPTNNPHTTWDMKYPYARVSYNSGLVRAIASVPETGDDSLVYAFSRNTSPTVWESRGVHNDFGITGEFGGEVEYSSDCNGGYIVYREYAMANVWCDAYNFTTGVDEYKTGNILDYARLAPNPVRDLARLSFTVTEPGMVNIVLYDATGKLVRSVLEETRPAGEYSVNIEKANLASGIYFVRIDTPAGVATKTMTIVR